MSPDANPIENVWSYIKMKLKRKSIYTLKQFLFQIKKIWRFLSTEYVQMLTICQKGVKQLSITEVSGRDTR